MSSTCYKLNYPKRNGEINYGIYATDHAFGEILITEKSVLNTTLRRGKRLQKRMYKTISTFFENCIYM